MNKIIILLFILLIGSTSIPKNKSEFCIPIEIENYHIKIKNKEIQDNKLIEALIQVESRGNDSCIGDRHLILPSIGCLQIRPVMVREVNRILKKQKDTLRFKYKDRWSRKKSIQMFYIWKDFHHTNSSDEKIARNWNGGPKGYKRKRTLQYWEKVKIEMSKKL